jgi:Flp pilus assembly protein CpaB
MIRRPPRAVALRVGAVLVVVITAGLVASDLAALHTRANDFGAPRDAVVVRHDLPIGATVDARDVTTRRIYSSQLPPGVLERVDQVVGRVVTVPLLRHGYVDDRHLAPRHRRGLDGAIPDGMRAVRIVVTDAVEPRVGAVVDVLARFETSQLSQSSFAADVDAADDDVSAFGLGSATVMAAAVLVLDVDHANASDGAPALGVTLLVAPSEAEDLLYAVTHGVVTIALVPAEEALER